jgi:hypothetical protein
MTLMGMHNTCAAQVYLRVGESVAAHAVEENDKGLGAGASRHQQRLVDTKDLQPKRVGNRRQDEAKGNRHDHRYCTLG